MTELSPDARLAAYFRHNWDKWAEYNLDIDFAKYRDESALRAWLEKQPPDSNKWVRDRLDTGNLTLDSKRSYQAEFLHAMSEPGWYVFQTANGIAKTATAAIAVLAFMDLYAESRIITTAGTWSQLSEQLWREIALWAQKAKNPITAYGRVGKTQINLSADWAAFGRGANKAETFEGVHAPNLMVVVDEAKAVPSDILDNAVRRIMRASDESRIWFLVMSSPGSPSGTFYDICTGASAHKFTHFHLSAYESERISLDQLGSDVNEIGEDSPLFISMNLGEFPPEGEDTVIPLHWIQSCVDRPAMGGPAVLGVDVAGTGGDETALEILIGNRALPPIGYPGKDQVWTMGKIRELNNKHNFFRIGIDSSGIPGLPAMVRAAKMPGVEINFGGTDKMRKPQYYVNNKVEMYWMLRAEFEAGFKDRTNPDVGISIPNDRKLIHQLNCQRFTFDNKQRYRMEGHAAMKARGEKSPDRADALALANFVRPLNAQPYNEQFKVANLSEAVGKGYAASILSEKW